MWYKSDRKTNLNLDSGRWIPQLAAKTVRNFCFLWTYGGHWFRVWEISAHEPTMIIINEINLIKNYSQQK